MPSSQIPLEQVFQFYELLYPTNAGDRDKLVRLLLKDVALNPVPFALLDYILTPKPGKSTTICKTVIVEKRYRDRDHMRAVSAFYSKAFRNVNSDCIRLHLFSRRLKWSDLGNLEIYNDSYMGFCVLRPFIQRKVGTTVLKRIAYNPELEFPTCQGNYDVNIGGSKLSISGTAFMEQDTMVAACASVAIWMCTSIMGHRYRLRGLSSSEITKNASEFYSVNRPMPSEGLVTEQMIHCLSKMDYEPVIFDVKDSRQAKHTIYTYVESEIPVILLCQLVTGRHHTIVCLGHGYHLPANLKQTEVEWPGEETIKFYRSSEWVPSMLINDDQRGIYRKLSFIDDNLEDELRQAYPDIDVDTLDLAEWDCPAAIDLEMPNARFNGGKDILNIWGILVPFPPGVLLSGEQAEKKAARLIKVWHDLNHTSMPENLVFRTYAIQSNEYKQGIARSGMNSFVKYLLRGKPMPRWIWVTEISSIESYNSPDFSNWLINGVVIIDATSNAFTPDFLAFHYVTDENSYVTTMLPEHEEAEKAILRSWYSDTSDRFSGLVR